MDLEAVMDQAWDFLEKSMEDKKKKSQAEGERLSAIEQDREETKRMGFSSQEKIQSMISKGLIDKQELVNQGVFSQQQLKNTGLMDIQEAEGRTQMGLQDKRNSGALAVQDRENEGSLARTKMTTSSAQSVEKIKGINASNNNWQNVKNYNGEGSVIGERLLNANPQQSYPVENDAGNDYENDPEGSVLESLIPGNAQSSVIQPRGVTPLSDGAISSGRHTAGRTMGLARSPLERDKKKSLYNQNDTRRFS
jgi:hypothetical protein